MTIMFLGYPYGVHVPYNDSETTRFFLPISEQPLNDSSLSLMAYFSLGIVFTSLIFLFILIALLGDSLTSSYFVMLYFGAALKFVFFALIVDYWSRDKHKRDPKTLPV